MNFRLHSQPTCFHYHNECERGWKFPWFFVFFFCFLTWNTFFFRLTTENTMSKKICENILNQIELKRWKTKVTVEVFFFFLQRELMVYFTYRTKLRFIFLQKWAVNQYYQIGYSQCNRRRESSRTFEISLKKCDTFQ